MKKILLLFTCFSLDAASSFNGNLYTQLSGHFGNSIWTKESYGQFGLYSVPDMNNAVLGVVLQEEAFYLADHQWANSFGLGLRLADSCDHACGINAFYDYFGGRFGGMKQLGAGLEVITAVSSFRFNGYLPFHVTGKCGKTKKYSNYVGQYFEFITPVQFLYQGFEFIADRGMYVFDLYFQGQVGVYYIDDFFKSNSFGFETRGEIWWHSLLFGGVFFTYDNIFKGQVQGYIGLSLPFYSINTNTYPPAGMCPKDFLSGKSGKTARIPRWGLGCPGNGHYYKTSWKPTCDQ